MNISMEKSLKYLFMALCCLSACQSPPKSNVEYIDPFIGTGAHGHTYPGATVPFGAVQLSPDTRKGDWDACAGYHYSDSNLFGFSHTHLSGTGCIDLGDILLRPTTQPLQLSSDRLYLPTSFSHKDEYAEPGYYRVFLPKEGVLAELSATMHAGIHRYTFKTKEHSSIIVDLGHLLDKEDIYESSIKRISDYEISGMRRTRGWVDNQYVFFTMQFSEPIEEINFFDHNLAVANTTLIEGTDLQAKISFGQKKIIVVKVGLSIVSEDNARENLKNEINGFDFDDVKSRAYDSWKKALSIVDVKGGTEQEKRIFYTAWYHSMVVPNTVSDVNGMYRAHDMSIKKAPNGNVIYSTFSTWDTFRAWHPLMTLVDTTLVNNIINSFLSIYEDSGELPIWPLSAGETNTMIGYHAVSIIADAYMKGICGFNAEKALEAMIKSSEMNKKGADLYIKNGFIPADVKKESVSCLLEFAYDDWAIAQMAKKMGKEDIYQTYISRSQNYINVFDGYTRFFRGKRRDGNWVENFNAYEVGRDYTEATAWQYRFFVPHDINGLIQQFGGEINFKSSLDSLFTVPYGVDGHLSDITGLIGQYAHGNEPSHHMAYLYSYIGTPWHTQFMTRRILKEMYADNPEGLIGNEDCGQMSAWYILSSMGFYPVCPGSNEYVLTSPLFNEVKLRLANGKYLTIKSNSSKKNIYIQEVKLNNELLKSNYITHEQLMKGGVLEFVLGEKPNKEWGEKSNQRPYSYTKENVVSQPYVDKDLNLFMDKIIVTLGCATQGASIYYTLDGTEPTTESARFVKPFMIEKTTQIKAKGFKPDMTPSRTFSIEATKANMRPSVSVSEPKPGVFYSYYMGTFSAVDEMLALKPHKTGIVTSPKIDESEDKDHFGYIFEGYIDVSEDGVYLFATKSDDGSVLFIDDVKVVDNDGSHAAMRAFGRIALQRGFHKYKLYYFEDYEGEELVWEWKVPSATHLTIVPDNVLYINRRK